MTGWENWDTTNSHFEGRPVFDGVAAKKVVGAAKLFETIDTCADVKELTWAKMYLLRLEVEGTIMAPVTDALVASIDARIRELS